MKDVKNKDFLYFMLSFIMSSWDLLFLRITSSHVSLKTEVNDVLTDYDYIENKQTIVLGKYIVHLFQTIPWWHDKKDKMWSKIAFMLSSRHKSLFSENNYCGGCHQNKGFFRFYALIYHAIMRSLVFNDHIITRLSKYRGIRCTYGFGFYKK